MATATMIKAPTLAPIGYRGLFGEIIHEVFEGNTEATNAAMMATLVTLASHTIPNAVSVVNGEYEHKICICMVIVGPSSLGQKGASWSMVGKKLWMKAFPDIYNDESPFFEEGYPQSGASLVRTLNEAITLANDEELHDGREDFNWFCLEEEFASVLRDFKSSKKLSTYTRKAWDGETIAHSITGSNGKIVKILIKKLKAVILGHISPMEWQATLNDADLRGGTVNRFLFAASESNTRLPSGGKIDQKKLTAAIRSVQLCMARAAMQRQIRFDDAAAKAWDDHYYDEVCDLIAKGEGMGDLYGRSKAYALRLAAMFAITSTPFEDSMGRRITKIVITKPDLDAAMEWIRFSAKSAEYANGAVIASDGPSPLAKKIHKAILASDKPLDGRAMQLVVGGNTVKGKWIPALAQLTDCGMYHNEKNTNGRKGYLVDLLARIPEGARMIDLRGETPEDEEDEVITGAVVDEAPERAAKRPQGAKVPNPRPEPARPPMTTLSLTLEDIKPKAAPQRPAASSNGSTPPKKVNPFSRKG